MHYNGKVWANILDQKFCENAASSMYNLAMHELEGMNSISVLLEIFSRSAGHFVQIKGSSKTIYFNGIFNL